MLRFLLLFLLVAPGLSAAPAAPALPDRVRVEPMKTSIYVGSVRLVPSTFERVGEDFTATYEARVFPWAFWSESGRIRLQIPATDLARLAHGEVIDFTGDAQNHRGKPRQVTGRAYPEGAATGKIKVRIAVDDVELIFNGRYEFPSS
ncbi:MAG: hypothetical protein RLZZ129_946 [Verrucomicrobiota bacterium]|jgi:lipocalin